MTPTEKAASGLLTEQGEAARWPSLRRSASLALKVGSNFVQEGPPKTFAVLLTAAKLVNTSVIPAQTVSR